MSSTAQGSNGPTIGMNSREVPSYCNSVAQRSTSSSRDANRDGTMCPSASLCVRAHDDEKPSAPASSPARRSACIAASSSGLASRAVASSPITTRRIAECPTMNPALMPRRPSISSKYSAVVVQFHGTPSRNDSSGMPSTRASMRMR